ncbi:MAG: Protein-export rane protein SecF [Frankiales bacterium]|nr:Protein-export rane protein SecF [Frankiales bacterium]
MSKIGQVGHRLYTGEVSYDFVGRKRTWYTVSAAIILISVAALLTRGLNFGIEFKGGADFRLPAVSCSVQDARQAVEPLTTAEPIVQKIGGNSVRVQTEVLQAGGADQIATVLAKTCGVDISQVNRNVIGATWGNEVSKKAITALIVFLILVSIFIRVLFETKMAIAAIVALLHDLLITIGLYSLIGFEVTPATVIGMLTILGYSLYDTIVVFDSLRENTRNLGRTYAHTYSEAANLSINQTLVRSINTSVIALLPIGAILFVGSYLLGAGTLKDLSLVLFIGITASTFSSIFFATPLVAQLKEREPEMRAVAKKVHSNRAKAARQAEAPLTTPPAEGGGTTTALLERETKPSAPKGYRPPPRRADGSRPSRKRRG